MAVLISVGYFSLLISAILLSRKIRYTRRQKMLMAFFFAMAMAIVAFNTEVQSDWDLARHFIWIDEIRNSDLSMIQFLFHNNQGVGLSEYRTLIFFNFIRYLVTILTDNNYWLPFVCVLITYSIVGYIMVDWYDTNGFGEKIGITSPLLCFALLPILHAFTGMRTALASAIMGMAIYLFIYKKKSIILFFLLVFISITIQQVFLIAIPFVFLAKMNFGRRALLWVFIISFSMNNIVLIVSQLSIPYLERIVQMYQSYTSSSQFRGTKYAVWSTAVFIVAFLMIYLVLGSQFEKYLWNKEQKQLYMFLLYYMCFDLGNIQNYDMFIRPSYLLGVLAPALVTLIENKFIWKKAHGRMIQQFGKLLCVILCLMAFYVNTWPIIRVHMGK